jgi:hypothetical protein
MRIELADRGFDFETDKAFLKYSLARMLKLPKENHPAAFAHLLAKNSQKEIDSFVDKLYAQTILRETAKRLEMLHLTPKSLLKLKDPFIKLAVELENELKILRDKRKGLSQEKLDIKGAYLRALIEKEEREIAPDANSSIRFTYGPVKGYFPKDAVYYSPVTTLDGVMEKESGTFPFRVPDKLKNLYQEKDYGRYLDTSLKSIPICFLNTTNVTGGNSGSPVLNARGEQVGIVFDMTYESVIGDYFIIPKFQRTISVDIRYVIFVTDKFSGANFLLKEMGL